jgi:hypothetical protein
MTLGLAGTRPDAGVSVVELNLKFVWETVQKTKVGKGGVAYVVDAGGRVFAHPDFDVGKVSAGFVNSRPGAGGAHHDSFDGRGPHRA